MNLDALFKGRRDTHSLSNLLAVCESKLMPNQAKECWAKLKAVKPLVKGVGILRGNYFGHRNPTESRDVFFVQAGLKIRDVDELWTLQTGSCGNWLVHLFQRTTVLPKTYPIR